jgi:hypothetical protein
MVVARGDCMGLPVSSGALGLLELKERFQQGLEEHVTAVLSLPAALGSRQADAGCAQEQQSLGAPAAEAVPSLDTRLAACQALAEDAMGGSSKAAISLTELLADALPEVRRAASEALVCIADFGPRSAVRAAGVALRLSDPGLRWRSHEHGLAMAALAARADA